MELMEAIQTRRSVRSYKDEPVDKQTIEQLLDAAVQAPCAMNRQPYAFAVIQDKNILSELSKKTKAYISSKLDQMPALERYRVAMATPDYDIFYGAGTLIFICARPNLSPAPDIDCALAAQNLMLAARDKGLGTCWIGFAGIYLSNAEARKEIGIPEDYTVVAPVIVGHPSGDFFKVEKNAPEMIFWK